MPLDSRRPRGSTLLRSTFAVALACVCALAHGAQSHISGHVISHLTGLPLTNDVYIDIDRPDGSWVEYQYATPDANGAYSWSGDCPDSGSTCIAHLYISAYNSPQYETLDTAFANGDTNAVIDFNPHALGGIMASLSGPNGGAVYGIPYLPQEALPEAGDQGPPVVLFAFDAGSSTWRRLDSLDAGTGPGFVQIRSLPAGHYRLCAGGIDTQLQRQCFDHQPSADTWAKQTFTDIDLAEGESRTLQFNLSAGGTIGGTLTDAFRNRPYVHDSLGDVARVELYDADGALFDRGVAFVKPDGSYIASGTPHGTFRIVTGLLDPAFREHRVLFPSIPCPGEVCPIALGQPVATDVSGNITVDLALHPSVLIRGGVIDAETLRPIIGAKVDDYWLLPSNFGGVPPPPYHVAHSDHTDGSGNYTVYAQPGKSLTLEATADGYLPTCVGASTCPPQLSGEDGETLWAPNIALHRASSLSGALRDLAGHPVEATVVLYDTSGQAVAFAQGTGTYHVPRLPAGTYYAMAQLIAAWPADCQVYANRPCQGWAGSVLDMNPAPIVIGNDSERTGVDFILATDGVFGNGFQ